MTKNPQDHPFLVSKMIETIQGIIGILLGLYFIVFRKRNAERSYRFIEDTFNLHYVSQEAWEFIAWITGIFIICVGLLLVFHII